MDWFKEELEKIPARVDAGFNKLQSVDPDWINRLPDDETLAKQLDMGSCGLCVLGFAYRNERMGYNEGCARLGMAIDFNAQLEHGFERLTSNETQSEDERDKYANALRDEWLRRIALERLKGQVS